jgi:hypothetical protein
MSGGAHHLDLREPNDDADPTDVKTARTTVTNKITEWIAAW